ncbi:hypothetical protein QVA77_07515 [Staphylococcus epidermidis]|nr:hypothetical protein [Staphylococcus epidermidis]MDU0432545.1 hypothetical protein [Staphylococcus epidermidis]MDU0446324.1 hypothetical protein [Staphylococcus epidermidis]MDU0456289.1 hypothetical protein [Staphylococcus epidermidis]MDU0469328.1 hypothetical protein [Staphylococcus epidermidis]
MAHNIFEQYPYWVNSTGCYELIPAKNKSDEDKVIRLSSPIIIKTNFLPLLGSRK